MITEERCCTANRTTAASNRHVLKVTTAVAALVGGLNALLQILKIVWEIVHGCLR